MRRWVRIGLAVLALLLASAAGASWWLARWAEGYLHQPPLPPSPAGLMAGLDALSPGMAAAEAASALAGLGATTRLTWLSASIGGGETLEARFRDGTLSYGVAEQKVGQVLALFDTPGGDASACRQVARDLADTVQARLGPPPRSVRDDNRLYRLWPQEKDWLFLADRSAPVNGSRPYCVIMAGRQSEKDASTCQQRCHGK